MIPRPFEYFAPESLEDAISLLTRFHGEAKVLAGGQSLVPLMKLRIASPACIVDINGVKGLEYIRDSEGILAIGALTRISDLERSASLAERVPIICEAASQIADPLVRNMGTIGGNIAHGDPTNDMPAVMIALDSELALAGPKGARRVKANDFFVDTFTTAAEPDEILKEVRIPLPPPRSGGSYLKFDRQAGDFAIAGVAAQVTLDKGGVCSSMGIGLTAVGPTALRARKAEDSMLGEKPTAGVIAKSAEVAGGEARPMSDLRGSAEYKREIVKVLTRRALEIAIRRARGKRV